MQFSLCMCCLADASQYQADTQMKKKKKRKAANTAESEPVTEQRRRELEHYLQLKRYDLRYDDGRSAILSWHVMVVVLMQCEALKAIVWMMFISLNPNYLII